MTTNRFGHVVHGRTLSSRRAQHRVAEFYPYSSKRLMDRAKREAAIAVNEAKRLGTLVPQPCSKCGKKKAEAHHEDYAKPLDVNWLCRPHHRRRDAELRIERRKEVRHLAELPVLFPPKNKTRTSCVATVELVKQATEEVSTALDAEGISELILSRRLKVSRQMVNMQFAAGFRSLKLLAGYADALGYDARVVLRKRHVSSVQQSDRVSA